MVHGKDEPIAADQGDYDLILFMIAEHGAAVGLGVFALLSLWAVIIIIYRAIKKEQDAPEISAERHAPESELSENRTSQDSSVEDSSEAAWNELDFNPCVTPKDELKQCESGLEKDQEEHPTNLQATDHPEAPSAHSNLGMCTTPRGPMDDPQISSCGSDYHNDPTNLPGHVVDGCHGDIDTDDIVQEPEMAVGNQDSDWNMHVREKAGSTETDSEVATVKAHRESPVGCHYHNHKCLCVSVNNESGVRGATSDKMDALKMESDTKGWICQDEDIKQRTTEGNREFSVTGGEAGECDREDHVDILDMKCSLPEKHVEEHQGDLSPATSGPKESRCKGWLDGDPVGKRVVVVPPLSQVAEVQFGVHYVTSSPFQQLAVTGSLPELGDWNSFVTLSQSSDWFWAGTVALPPDSRAQWKFVLVQDGKIQRWEECENRYLEIGSDRDLVLHKSWGII